MIQIKLCHSNKLALIDNEDFGEFAYTNEIETGGKS
jgi:hypothetical protein